MGRLCAVPHCYTGYKRKSTEKISLYKVPDDDFFLTKWQEAIAREDRPITPKDYVCEKHFTQDDIIRKRIRKDVVEEYQRPKLRQDAIPSIFPDLPEFILKMTKKRRKIVDATINTNNTNDILLNKVKLEPGDLDIKPEIKIEHEAANEIEAFRTEINTDEIEIKEEIDCEPLDESEEIEEVDCNGDKLFRCDVCEYRTKFSHNLKTHKVKHLSGEDAYMTCELCTSFKTKWEITYTNHMKTKHKVILKELFKCPFCKFKTKNKNFLLKHRENQHENQDEGCAASLIDDHQKRDYKIELPPPVTNNTPTDNHNCEAPQKSIINEICIEDHKKSNVKVTDSLYYSQNPSTIRTQDIEPIKKTSRISTETKKGTKESKLNSKTSKTGKKIMFNCSRCPFKAHSQFLLDYHLLKHEATANKVPICCQKCSFVTFTQDELEKHWKNSFHCDQCPYVSEKQADYLKHILSHEDASMGDEQYSIGPIKEEKHEVDGVELPNVQEFCMVTIKEERQDLLDE